MDNHCAMCGDYLADTGRMVCEKCEKPKTELKLCPFCGGKARTSADTEATRDSQGRLWAFTVVCDRCCASSGLTFTTDRAIEAWNRRAEDA